MDTKEYRYSGDRKFNINGFDTADTGEFKDRDGCAALFEKISVGLKRIRTSCTPREKTPS
jgi:hypothetical protein